MKSLILKILNNKILMSSAFFSAISVMAGIINFIFNILIARILGPEQYGMIYPLTSLLMILVLPLLSFQFIFTRYFSENIHNKDFSSTKKLFYKIILSIIGFNLIISILFIIALPSLKAYLHINETLPFIIILMVILINSVHVPLNSLSQAREIFFKIGLSQFITAIIKLFVGVFIVYQTIHYHGALWGLLISALFYALLLFIDNYFFLKPYKISQDTPIPYNLKKITKNFLLTLLSIGAFQGITYLDSVLVRHFLKDQSGLYSTVNLLGKASFFLATGVSFVMLPILSKDKKNIKKNNWIMFGILTVALIVFATSLAVFSPFIAKVIYGNKFIGIDVLLPLYGFMFIPYSAISYLVNYYVLTENIIYIITIILGGIIQTLGIFLFHQNLIQVSLIVGISGYFILVLLVLDTLFFKTKLKRITYES